MIAWQYSCHFTNLKIFTNGKSWTESIEKKCIEAINPGKCINNNLSWAEILFWWMQKIGCQTWIHKTKMHFLSNSLHMAWSSKTCQLGWNDNKNVHGSEKCAPMQDNVDFSQQRKSTTQLITKSGKVSNSSLKVGIVDSQHLRSQA